jgi:hypothetical protein
MWAEHDEARITASLLVITSIMMLFSFSLLTGKHDFTISREEVNLRVLFNLVHKKKVNITTICMARK